MRYKEITSLNVETNNLLAVLGDRISRGKFPLNWNSGLQSATLLYLLVRNFNVYKVLEVGTGNGVSSLAFIEALAKNSSKSEFITSLSMYQKMRGRYLMQAKEILFRSKQLVPT